MVCVVRVLISYLVCHRVVLLVHCYNCCALLTFQGYFRMCWLIMLTTLPCFVEYHILVIGHMWQHHWMMIWLWSEIVVVVGESKQDEGDAYFLISYRWALVPWFGCWWYCCWNGLRVKDFGCYSKFKVNLREASQNNSCFCFKEGLVFWGR